MAGGSLRVIQLFAKLFTEGSKAALTDIFFFLAGGKQVVKS